MENGRKTYNNLQNCIAYQNRIGTKIDELKQRGKVKANKMK